MSHQCVNAYISSNYTGAPFYVANGGIVDNADGSGAVSVPYPAGLAENDIAFLQAVIFDSTASNSVNTPAGWTLVSQDQVAGSALQNHALFWKRLDGTESGSVNITTTGGHGATDTFAGAMSIWRGCITTGTPYESLANNAGSSADMAGSTVHALGPRRTIVNICTCNDDTLSAPATNWTEQYDLTTTSGSHDGGLKAYSIEQAVEAVVPGVVHTLAASEAWQVKSFALIKSGSDLTSTHTRVPAGDMNSGNDRRIPAGDMQSGSDLRKAEEIT